MEKGKPPSKVEKGQSSRSQRTESSGRQTRRVYSWHQPTWHSKEGFCSQRFDEIGTNDFHRNWTNKTHYKNMLMIWAWWNRRCTVSVICLWEWWNRRTHTISLRLSLISQTLDRIKADLILLFKAVTQNSMELTLAFVLFASLASAKDGIKPQNPPPYDGSQVRENLQFTIQAAYQGERQVIWLYLNKYFICNFSQPRTMSLVGNGLGLDLSNVNLVNQGDGIWSRNVIYKWNYCLPHYWSILFD